MYALRKRVTDRETSGNVPDFLTTLRVSVIFWCLYGGPPSDPRSQVGYKNTLTLRFLVLSPLVEPILT